MTTGARGRRINQIADTRQTANTTPPMATAERCCSQKPGAISPWGGRRGGIASTLVLVEAKTIDWLSRRIPNAGKQNKSDKNPNAEIRTEHAPSGGAEIPTSDFVIPSDLVIRISAFLSPPSPSSRLEEVLQGLRERFSGAKAQRIHAGSLKRPIQLGQALGVRIGKLLADDSAGRVQFQQFTGFGILDRQETSRRQRCFTGIVQVQADQIMPRVRETDLLEGVTPGPGTARVRTEAVQEIGEQKNDRPPVQHVIQECERGGNICPAMFRLKMQRLAKDPQNMA